MSNCFDYIYLALTTPLFYCILRSHIIHIPRCTISNSWELNKFVVGLQMIIDAHLFFFHLPQFLFLFILDPLLFLPGPQLHKEFLNRVQQIIVCPIYLSTTNNRTLRCTYVYACVCVHVWYLVACVCVCVCVHTCACVCVCACIRCVCGGMWVWVCTVVLYKNNTCTQILSAWCLSQTRSFQVISNHKLQVMPHTSVIPEKWQSFIFFWQ